MEIGVEPPPTLVGTRRCSELQTTTDAKTDKTDKTDKPDKPSPTMPDTIPPLAPITPITPMDQEDPPGELRRIFNLLDSLNYNTRHNSVQIELLRREIRINRTLASEDTQEIAKAVSECVGGVHEQLRSLRLDINRLNAQVHNKL